MDENGLRKILFVPGFIGDKKTLHLIPDILGKVQSIFNLAGWEILVSNYYQGRSTTLPLDIYAGNVREKVFSGKWDAVIAHSMGGLLLPDRIEVPVIIIESPINGVTRWQFRVVNFLATLKGQYGFPLDNLSVQGMLRDSTFMQTRNKSPSWAHNALQINGALGCSSLARWDGNTFGEIPGIIPDNYREFPEIDHIGLLTNPKVIRTVLDFLEDIDWPY